MFEINNFKFYKKNSKIFNLGNFDSNILEENEKDKNILNEKENSKSNPIEYSNSESKVIDFIYKKLKKNNFIFNNSFIKTYYKKIILPNKYNNFVELKISNLDFTSQNAYKVKIQEYLLSENKNRLDNNKIDYSDDSNYRLRGLVFLNNS
jgi:hypothetical protein